MPEMDGLDGLRARSGQFSDVPILMLTAKAEDMDKLIGFDHGADDYMTKPFNILELKARVRALLRRAKRGPEAGRLADRRLHSPEYPEQDGLPGQYPGRSDRSKSLTWWSCCCSNPERVYSPGGAARRHLGLRVPAAIFGRWTCTSAASGRSWRRILPQPQHILTKWGVGYYFKA